MSKLIKFLKEPKIILVLLVVLVAIVAIRPTPVPTPEGTMTIQTNIEQGLDLQGGVRCIILPEISTKEIVDRSITVLTTRINAYGLKEMNIKPVAIGDKWFIQLELAGSTPEDVKDILEKQGKFEATINRYIELSNNKGVLKFNGNDYSVSIVNDKLVVNGNTVAVNESFDLEGVELVYVNISSTEATVKAKVYTGADILQTFRDVEHATIRQIDVGQWQFQFMILTSKASAEKFAKVTKDVEVEMGGTKQYLKTNIDLYLDDVLVDSLRVASGLRGEVLTQPYIQGPGANEVDARQSMMSLQAILESGALPTKIKIEKMEAISATLGAQFLQLSIIAILAAILAVAVIVFIRYRDPIFVIPIIITSSTEVFLILGIAAAIHWTIDLAAIAGIMAAIGTGVDNQIVITDESSDRKATEELSIKRRLERAFFIIFASGATTIAAMVPLLSIGAGNIRGFAFTTIIGVLIGILITRPMYAKVIEYIKR